MTIYDKLISQENLFPRLGSAYLQSKEVERQNFLKNISQLAEMEKQKEYLAIQKQYAETEKSQRDVKNQILQKERDILGEDYQLKLQKSNMKKQRWDRAREVLSTQILDPRIPETIPFALQWLGKIDKLEKSNEDLSDDDFTKMTSDARSITEKYQSRMVTDTKNKERFDYYESLAKSMGPGFTTEYEKFKQNPEDFAGIPMEQLALIHENTLYENQAKLMRTELPYLQAQTTKESFPESLRSSMFTKRPDPQGALDQTAILNNEISKRISQLNEIKNRGSK